MQGGGLTRIGRRVMLRSSEAEGAVVGIGSPEEDFWKCRSAAV
jgi:hypothetical protein